MVDRLLMGKLPDEFLVSITTALLKYEHSEAKDYLILQQAELTFP